MRKKRGWRISNNCSICSICSMKGLSTADRGWVYCLQTQICCSRGPGAGNTCEGRGFLGDTVSHGGSTRQGDLRCNHSPRTQRFWSVSDGRRTVDERRGSSSCETPESIAVWRLSHRAHTCMGGFLQQRLINTAQSFNNQPANWESL